MILCNDIESTTGLANPGWTQLQSGGYTITNCAELVVWDADPVQLILCDSCGIPNCSSGGYGIIRRTKGHVIICPPNPSTFNSWELTEYEESHELRKAKGFLIPLATWRSLRENIEELPNEASIQTLTRREILELWFLGTPLLRECESVEEALEIIQDKTLALDSLDIEDGVEHFENLVNWALKDPELSIEIDFAIDSNFMTTVETFYFDGPVENYWPALHIEEHDQIANFAFGEGIVLVRQ